MRKLIRKIINWAYGKDIGSALIILSESHKNLSILLRDLAIRSYVKPGAVVKEEDL